MPGDAGASCLRRPGQLGSLSLLRQLWCGLRAQPSPGANRAPLCVELSIVRGPETASCSG